MSNESTENQFEYLKNKMQQFIHERDWEKFHTPKNVAMSVAIEAAELMELFQWNDLSKEEIISNENLISKIRDEMADIFIYLISMALQLDIDIYNCIVEKMDRNKIRFPPK